MLTCHLQFKMKSKIECLFLMYRLLVKVKHLPLLSALTISLVLFTHSLRDASDYAQVRPNYTLN